MSDISTEDYWTVKFEKSIMAPYMYKGLKWASYDDQTSIKAKVELASKHKLAGIMTWAIDLDDFLGKCTTTGIKFPLLTTVNHELYQQERKEHGSKGKQY